MIGLIPARQGSVRVPNKNLRKLGNLTLVEIAVQEALKSDVFDRVVVSTDSEEIAALCSCEVVMRPSQYATSTSPDIEWIRHVFEVINPDSGFAVLRPTSPFRSAETIRRGMHQLLHSDADSIRAVQVVSERPEKMWRLKGEQLTPYVAGRKYEQQSATFETLYVQNGCLEMAHIGVLPESVGGNRIAPFFTQGIEALDINTEEDYEKARRLHMANIGRQSVNEGQDSFDRYL